MFFFVIGIAFDLAQVLITLLLVFFDDSSIIISCEGIRKLAPLASFIQKRVFLRRLTQNLTSLISISTSIITISGKIVLFSLKIFLVSGFLIFKWSMVVKAAYVTFSYQRGNLLSLLSFGIHSSLDDRLLII